MRRLRTFWLRIRWSRNDNPNNVRRWGHRRRRVSVSLRQSDHRSTISAGQSPDHVDIANVENFTLRFFIKVFCLRIFNSFQGLYTTDEKFMYLWFVGNSPFVSNHDIYKTKNIDNAMASLRFRGHFRRWIKSDAIKDKISKFTHYVIIWSY